MMIWDYKCLWLIRCNKGWYFASFPRNVPYNFCLNVQKSIGSSSETVQSSLKIRNSLRTMVIGFWHQVNFVDLSMKSALSTRISLSISFSIFISAWIVTSRIIVIVFSKFSNYPSFPFNLFQKGISISGSGVDTGKPMRSTNWLVRFRSRGKHNT